MIVTNVGDLLRRMRAGATLHRMPIAATATAAVSQRFELRDGGQKTPVPYATANAAIGRGLVSTVGQSDDGSVLYALKIQGRDAIPGEANNKSPIGETR